VNLIHTVNMVHLRVVADDRRERAREAKRRRYLEAAGRIIERDGLGGVTMQALADELDCAVGTVYRYFPSKAALLAALQQQAVEALLASYRAARERWDDALAAEELEEGLVALVHLVAFGGFFAAASVVLADEFVLQRTLLTRRPAGGREEARRVLPVVHRLLEVPRGLLEDAVAHEVIEPGDQLERALRWVTALDGVLLLDALAPVDRHLFRAQHHARCLSGDLLVGWGADRADVEVAGSHVDRLAALGPLAPPPSGPGWD
jgi:AcrR family transcriptional regulator